MDKIFHRLLEPLRNQRGQIQVFRGPTPSDPGFGVEDILRAAGQFESFLAPGVDPETQFQEQQQARGRGQSQDIAMQVILQSLLQPLEIERARAGAKGAQRGTQGLTQLSQLTEEFRGLETEAREIAKPFTAKPGVEQTAEQKLQFAGLDREFGNRKNRIADSLDEIARIASVFNPDIALAASREAERIRTTTLRGAGTGLGRRRPARQRGDVRQREAPGRQRPAGQRPTGRAAGAPRGAEQEIASVLGIPEAGISGGAQPDPIALLLQILSSLPRTAERQLGA